MEKDKKNSKTICSILDEIANFVLNELDDHPWIVIIGPLTMLGVEVAKFGVDFINNLSTSKLK